jgi:hypothetical protein
MTVKQLAVYLDPEAGGKNCRHFLNCICTNLRNTRTQCCPVYKPTVHKNTVLPSVQTYGTQEHNLALCTNLRYTRTQSCPLYKPKVHKNTILPSVQTYGTQEHNLALCTNLRCTRTQSCNCETERLLQMPYSTYRFSCILHTAMKPGIFPLYIMKYSYYSCI